MLEKLKQQIQERTERNAIKSTLTWHKIKKRNGEIVSDKAITETVYLKRSRIPFVGDWGRIHPIVEEDENGKISWKVGNFVFGGRRNFIKLLFVLVIAALIFLGFKEIFTQYTDLRNFCEPIMGVFNSAR